MSEDDPVIAAAVAVVVLILVALALSLGLRVIFWLAYKFTETIARRRDRSGGS